MNGTKKQEIINLFYDDMHFEPSKDEKRFVEILKNLVDEREKDLFLRHLKSVNADNYDGSLMTWINKMQGRSKSLNPEISNFLKKNSFLLPDLSKSISENAWRLCHDMCSFVIKVDFSLKVDLIEVLDTQVKKYADVKCVRERVDALKNKL